MAYKVGEAAEILGLSPQGVRFLEQKQYLKSKRQENGYRIYDRRELTIAQQILGYASVGFTLKEAARMVLSSSLDTIESNLALCDERIQESIERLQSQRQALALRRQVVDRVRQNRPDGVCRDGQWLYLPLEGFGALEDTSEKRRIEREWMNRYPYTMLARLPLLADGTACDSRGVCVSRKDAEALGLPMPEGIIALPEGLYWSAVLCKPVGETKDYDGIYRQALAHGCVPNGPMLSIVELTVLQGDRRCTITQARLPVLQENEGDRH